MKKRNRQVKKVELVEKGPPVSSASAYRHSAGSLSTAACLQGLMM